jgi:DNA-binding NarL/FixJ family response regulator
MPRVLFIDDEPHVLQGLRRALRPLDSSFELEFCDDPAKAIGLLSHTQHDAIVTDMRMPVINGIDILRSICTVSPETLRIVLSGQSSKESCIATLSLAHRYIAKPCSHNDLIAITHAAELGRRILPSRQTRALIAQIQQFPVQAVNYHNFIEVNSTEYTPERTCEHYMELASQDVGFAGLILRLYLMTVQSSTLRYTDLSKMCRTISPSVLEGRLLVAESLSQRNGDKSSQDLKELSHWRTRSLTIAQELSKFGFVENKDLLLCMLELLAIGRLYFYDIFDVSPNNRDQKVYMQSDDGERTIISAEQISAYLASLWGLPTAHCLTLRECTAPLTRGAYSDVTNEVIGQLHAIVRYSRELDCGVREETDNTYREREMIETLRIHKVGV